MDKKSFKLLFLENVDLAISQGGKPSRNNLSELYIEMHGAGESGKIINLDQALDAIYISEKLFYRIIDIAIKSVSNNSYLIFLRISAHKPAKFEETWNNPIGNGPFKIISETK